MGDRLLIFDPFRAPFKLLSQFLLADIPPIISDLPCQLQTDRFSPFLVNEDSILAEEITKKDDDSFICNLKSILGPPFKMNTVLLPQTNIIPAYYLVLFYAPENIAIHLWSCGRTLNVERVSHVLRFVNGCWRCHCDGRKSRGCVGNSICIGAGRGRTLWFRGLDEKFVRGFAGVASS